jgi:hypothetical protein
MPAPQQTGEMIGASSHRRSPTFLVAWLGAAMSSIVAWIVVGIVALPLLLATATSTAFGPTGAGSLAALSAAGLVVLLSQPLIAAGLLKVSVSALCQADLGFGRAAAAMAVCLIVTGAASISLPPTAAIPVLGYSWVGALVAGWIVSR